MIYAVTGTLLLLLGASDSAKMSKNATALNVTIIGAANSNACSDDHKKFCGPKVGVALDACMKEHYKELSSACVEAEFKHFKLESKNEKKNPLIQAKCAADIQRFCKAYPGDVVNCLGSKIQLVSQHAVLQWNWRKGPDAQICDLMVRYLALVLATSRSTARIYLLAVVLS